MGRDSAIKRAEKKKNLSTETVLVFETYLKATVRLATNSPLLIRSSPSSLATERTIFDRRGPRIIRKDFKSKLHCIQCSIADTKFPPPSLKSDLA